MLSPALPKLRAQPLDGARAVGVGPKRREKMYNRFPDPNCATLAKLKFPLKRSRLVLTELNFRGFSAKSSKHPLLDRGFQNDTRSLLFFNPSKWVVFQDGEDSRSHSIEY